MKLKRSLCYLCSSRTCFHFSPLKPCPQAHTSLGNTQLKSWHKFCLSALPKTSHHHIPAETKPPLIPIYSRSRHNSHCFTQDLVTGVLPHLQHLGSKEAIYSDGCGDKPRRWHRNQARAVNTARLHHSVEQLLFQGFFTCHLEHSSCHSMSHLHVCNKGSCFVKAAVRRNTNGGGNRTLKSYQTSSLTQHLLLSQFKHKETAGGVGGLCPSHAFVTRSHFQRVITQYF